MLSSISILCLSVLLYSLSPTKSAPPPVPTATPSVPTSPPSKEVSINTPIGNLTEFVIDLVLETFCVNRSAEGAKIVHEEKETAKQIISGLLKQIKEEHKLVEEAPSSNVTNPAFLKGACTDDSTKNLTEYWRKDGNGSQIRPIDGRFACDDSLQSDTVWFRFAGEAGQQLSNECRPSYSCGAHGGFWSDAEMPVEVGEIRHVPIYGSWASNCQWYSWPTANSLTVQRCSEQPGDFVYRVHGTVSCFWTFCSMDAE